MAMAFLWGQSFSLQTGSAQVTVASMAGDVNGDGAITAADLLWFEKYLADPTSVPAAAQINMDIDQNGVADTADKQILRQYIVGGYGIVLP